METTAEFHPMKGVPPSTQPLQQYLYQFIIALESVSRTIKLRMKMVSLLPLPNDITASAKAQQTLVLLLLLMLSSQ